MNIKTPGQEFNPSLGPSLLLFALPAAVALRAYLWWWWWCLWFVHFNYRNGVRDLLVHFFVAVSP